jgi:predicted ATPase
VLTRLYADNYKALVNFEVKFGREHVLLGANGSGKTTVFELVSRLTALLWQGHQLGEMFPRETLTRFEARTQQHFEIEAKLGGTTFLYRLVVEHRADQEPQIESERLSADGVLAFSSERGEAQFTDDGGTEPRVLLVEPTRSGLSAARRRGSSQIDLFFDVVDQILAYKIDPSQATARSEREAPVPFVSLSNFASWYRHLVQIAPNEMSDLRESLRQAFRGFDSLRFTSEGEGVRTLKSAWRLNEDDKNSKQIELAFDELSDGQRAIVMLYAVMHAVGDRESTLFLDEPDNFVALAEIQPWLSELRDRPNLQTLIISHHPQVINDRAKDTGLLFHRSGVGPVRVSPFKAPTDSILTPADVVARGWEHGDS